MLRTVLSLCLFAGGLTLQLGNSSLVAHVTKLTETRHRTAPRESQVRRMSRHSIKFLAFRS